MSWIGSTGNWTDAQNWSSGTVPTPPDQVVIGNGGTALLSTGDFASAFDFTIQNSSTLNVSNGAQLTLGASHDFYIGGSSGGALEIASGAIVSVDSGQQLAPSYADSVSVDGISRLYAGTIYMGYLGAGNLTLTHGCNITVGSILFNPNGGGNLTIGIDPENLTYNAATHLTANGTLIPVIALTGVSLTGGKLTLVDEYTPTKGDTATLILTNGPITTTFANAANNGFVDQWQISYSTYAVNASYVGNSLANIPGLTANQYNVAVGLDSAMNNGGLPQLKRGLGRLSNSQLPGALDQLTPLKFENFTSSTADNNAGFSILQMDDYLANHRGADGKFISSNGGIDYSGLTVNDPNIDSTLQMIHSRLVAWNPAPGTGLLSDVVDPVLGGIDMKSAAVPPNPDQSQLWNVFVQGNAVFAQTFSDATAGLPHGDAATGGVQLGVDYRLTPHFLLGALFGYGHTDGTLDNLGSEAQVDTYSPGIYASYSDGGWYANGLATYGFANYRQNRNVAIGGFGGSANGSPSGDQVVANLDGGYDFHRGGWTYGPTLGLQYVHLHVDGYTESGLPEANLSVAQSDGDSLRSRLGGEVRYAFSGGGVLFTPHLDASWQHEFLDQSRGITSQFDGAGAGSFIVNTPNPSRDSALADIGLDARLDKTWTLFAQYTVQVGQSNYFGQSVEGGIKIGF